MKSKVHFGLIVGIIALASDHALAEETHSWVNFDTAVAGSAAGGSIAILSSAAKTISIRMEGTAYSSRLASSTSIKEDLIRPLVTKKADLDKELADVQKRYEKSYADLQGKIDASNKLVKIAPGQFKTFGKSDLPFMVDMAFAGTDLLQKKRDSLKKESDLLNNRIAAIAANLESKTYSAFLTPADLERIQKIRPTYNSAKLREAEAETILKRSKKIGSIAKAGNAAALPVAFGTMLATAFVSNKTEKAKAATSSSSSSQNETDSAAATTTAVANQAAQ